MTASSPGFIAQSALGGKGGKGGKGGGKGGAEFIAHGFEHVTVVDFNGLPQDVVVPVEGLLHGIGAAFPQSILLT